LESPGFRRQALIERSTGAPRRQGTVPHNPILRQARGEIVGDSWRAPTTASHIAGKPQASLARITVHSALRSAVPASAAVGIPGMSFARPDIPLPPIRGFQQQVPILPVAQMLLADVFPRHDRPWTLGAESFCLVTQLIGPRRGCMQFPVMPALLALDPQGAQATTVISPPTELAAPRQRLPTFSAKNRPPEAALP